MSAPGIQTYECRLRRGRMLRLSDVAHERVVSCTETAARVGHALCRDLPHEQVWIVMLGGRNDILGTVRIAEGGLHGAAIRPADVLRPVIVAGASACVLVHNHPSGDPTPSQDDRVLTKHLHAACELLGVHLLDHVVVTRDATLWRAMGSRGED